MGFSRQEYWSGLPCPPPGDLPHPGIEPWSQPLQVNSLLSEPPGKSHHNCEEQYSVFGSDVFMNEQVQGRSWGSLGPFAGLPGSSDSKEWTTKALQILGHFSCFY